MEERLLLLSILLCCFLPPIASKLVQKEVEALEQIVHTMGSAYWKFDDSSCEIKMVGVTKDPPLRSVGSIGCDCHFENNTCHVVSIALKFFDLPGKLPPELVKLPYLQEIDFVYNYLSGPIPDEWASLPLRKISLLVNRLSGSIPMFLGDMTNLTYLCLEANQFSGTIPNGIGNAINLESLLLSSNQLNGELPATLGRLKNLTDFRISDNYFNGTIPGFIGNWKQLQRLDMQASGLQGPIPPEIAYLDNLVYLRISEINGSTQGFPVLSKMQGLITLVLSNCGITGEIPAYIWQMEKLKTLDVSFNKLVGKIPYGDIGKDLNFIFLTSNWLTGGVPDTILNDGWSIDLSYNNLTWQGPEQPACQDNMNLNMNLFRSSSSENGLRRLLPCLKTVDCPRYKCSVHVNCGGDDLVVKDDEGKFLYEGDAAVEGGAANLYTNTKNYWGFSSTGDFMDDNNYQNLRYINEVSRSSNISGLYTTARVSPLTLTYFSYCLENGNYTVNLHFAEIRFTNNESYSSLGRRVFDIYIQDKLVWKNFNIELEAPGAGKPLIKGFNASVTNNTLEVRFYWASRGTTRIPKSGTYGPLVSAISVHSNFKRCKSFEKKVSIYIIATVCSVAIMLLGILSWKCVRQKRGKEDIKEGFYTLKQIAAATNNFSSRNKIGEGGFGPVYKGLLSDGTVVAVKQLSSTSKQGNREFLNEIGIISSLQHPNLVRLYGCCSEGDQLLLVYEYMENNSLASALFGPEGCPGILDWPTRVKIFVGIARGLAFLHEESRLKVVHRDIKATNVLLDRNLNAKISDFGLAKLGEDDKTHISTKIAGTVGYMAPEYALWGYLTSKADIYSFGVLALEIISGKSNHDYVPTDDCYCIIDWASRMLRGGMHVELLDPKLGSNFNIEEAEQMIKVALLCTSCSPSSRPVMSEVVKMMEGELAVPDTIPDPGTLSDDLRSKTMRGIHRHMSGSFSGSMIQNSTPDMTYMGSFNASKQHTTEMELTPKSF